MAGLIFGEAIALATLRIPYKKSSNSCLETTLKAINRMTKAKYLRHNLTKCVLDLDVTTVYC